MMCPPNAAPNWFCTSTGLTPVAGRKKPTAFSLVLRRNSQAEPWKSLVPLRTLALITAPPARPYSAEKLFVDDAELLDRVGIQLDDLVGEALVGGAVRVVIHAIHHEVVQRTAQAIHVERSIAVMMFDRRTPGDSSARSAYARPFSGRLTIAALLDNLAAVAGLGFERFRRSRHGNGLDTSPTCSVRFTRWRALTVRLKAIRTDLA